MENKEHASPLRVLIIEDCPDTRETLALLLRMWGYESREVDNGTTAVKIASDYHPDVILLDIGLPDLNGWEVVRQLRQQANLGHPFILGVSGHAGEVNRLRSCEAGCDDHWAKPVEPEILRRLLEARRASVN